MGTDQHHRTPSLLRCGSRHRRAGLTLVEVMVAAGMIALTCSVVMFVFTQLNRMAMITRLYTGAATAAQSEIDLLTTDGPFQPANNLVPTELQPGTATGAVVVYQDPISNFAINGTMTTTVTTNNTTYANGSETDSLYLYLATVTVTYTYRSRSYSVSFSTTRTSDI